MSDDKKILILYPSAESQVAGEALKAAFDAQGNAIQEMVIEGNVEAVLDALEQPVIPVVMR